MLPQWAVQVQVSQFLSFKEKGSFYQALVPAQAGLLFFFKRADIKFVELCQRSRSMSFANLTRIFRNKILDFVVATRSLLPSTPTLMCRRRHQLRFETPVFVAA